MAVTSCHGKQEYRPAEVTDFVSLFPAYASYDSARQVQVLDSLRPELTALMQVICADTTIDVNRALLDEWSRSAAITIFTPAVDSVFPTSAPVADAIGMIKGNASAKGLTLDSLEYFTVVWGKTASMMFHGRMMYIALNHYLGTHYPGYSSFPTYVRHYKTPENLPYDLAEALLAQAYPMQDRDKANLLQHMLYDGALVYLKTQVVDGADPALAIGMLPPQYKWMQDHEREVWEALAVRKMLYDTDQMAVNRVLAPSPGVPSLMPEAPGRLGRYIGYKIVEAYMKKHPDTKADYLLSPAFYLGKTTLIDAAYKP